MNATDIARFFKDGNQLEIHSESNVVGMSLEKVFGMCRIDEFWNIHETFPHFFSKQAKLRQSHRAETADYRFQISNFENRHIAYLMTCRQNKYHKFMNLIP